MAAIERMIQQSQQQIGTPATLELVANAKLCEANLRALSSVLPEDRLVTLAPNQVYCMVTSQLPALMAGGATDALVLLEPCQLTMRAVREHKIGCPLYVVLSDTMEPSFRRGIERNRRHDLDLTFLTVSELPRISHQRRLSVLVPGLPAGACETLVPTHVAELFTRLGHILVGRRLLLRLAEQITRARPRPAWSFLPERLLDAQVPRHSRAIC